MITYTIILREPRDLRTLTRALSTSQAQESLETTPKIVTHHQHQCSCRSFPSVAHLMVP
jgi:hypothetical protein